MEQKCPKYEVTSLCISLSSKDMTCMMHECGSNQFAWANARRFLFQIFRLQTLDRYGKNRRSWVGDGARLGLDAWSGLITQEWSSV